MQYSLFADDSAVFKSHKVLKYITHQIQKNVDKLEKLCDIWAFKVSMDKTVGVLFNRRVVGNNIKLTFDDKH